MPLDTTGDDPFAKFNTPTSPILFPVSERHVGWETRMNVYERINTHKSIVRMGANNTPVRVLAVVGSGYRLVHNSELLSRVEDTMRKIMSAHELTDVRVVDRVSSFGRMCYREYTFPNISCYIGSGSHSTVAFRMIVQNGYGGSALRVHAGAIDFWCTNGMITGDYTTTYRKHTSRLFVDGIGDTVSQALFTFGASQNKWREWVHKSVKHSAAMQLFRDIAQSTKLQDGLACQFLRERDSRGDNLWAVYSTLTYYASHNDGPFTLRSTVEQQDTVASTMLQRELNVSQWIKSEAWRKLEDA